MIAREPAATLPAPDGDQVRDGFAGHLDYLSNLARDLGVPDPVEEYFAPVVGRWSDLNAEADRWRLVGDAARDVTEQLNTPLGRLDAAWDGAAADSFIQYMQQIGLAGNDLSDAMLALADVLDITAEGIREIVTQLAEVLGETAESASEAMILPAPLTDERTRQYLDLMRRPTKELFEAVRQILEAFVRLCEGIDGSQAFRQIRMAHTFPAENWAFRDPSVPVAKPGAPEPTAASAAGGGAGGGGGGAGVGSFGGGGGAGGASAAALGSGGYTFATEQPPAPKPETTAAATGAGAGSGSRAGSGMMPMAPMMGAMGQGGDGGDHRSRSRVVGKPEDIFGTPEKASSPVIGAED